MFFFLEVIPCKFYHAIVEKKAIEMKKMKFQNTILS